MRRLTKGVLVAAVGVIVICIFAGLVCLRAAENHQRACQKHRRKDFADALRSQVHFGEARAEVRRLLASDGWDFPKEPKPAPRRLFAGKLTYCGLGSSLMVNAAFEFDQRDRLIAYELDDGVQTALRVER